MLGWGRGGMVEFCKRQLDVGDVGVSHETCMCCAAAPDIPHPFL